MQEVLLAAVPATYQGLQCWCPVDVCDETVLKDRNIIKAEVASKGRSLSANSLWAVWYNQISKRLNEDTPAQVKAFCKLQYAVPILLAEDKEFRAFYENAFKDFNYKQIIFSMRFVPVTSLLSRSQGQRYQTTLQQEYAKRGVQLEIL